MRAETSPAMALGDPARLLLIWLSPSFPVGAFAYSHGLESAAAQGLVADRTTLQAWLQDLLLQGSVRNDAILLAAAWRASIAFDLTALAAINTLALALQPSAERYLETSQQGASFITTVAAAWPCAIVGAIRGAGWTATAYPVAVAAAAAGHGISRQAATQGFALAFVQNLTSAAIRLSVIGQTDGQRVLAALEPTITAVAAQAAHGDLDALGSGTWSSDLASIEHETLYSRLFRS